MWKTTFYDKRRVEGIELSHRPMQIWGWWAVRCFIKYYCWEFGTNCMLASIINMTAVRTRTSGWHSYNIYWQLEIYSLLLNIVMGFPINKNYNISANISCKLLNNPYFLVAKSSLSPPPHIISKVSILIPCSWSELRRRSVRVLVESWSGLHRRRESCNPGPEQVITSVSEWTVSSNLLSRRTK